MTLEHLLELRVPLGAEIFGGTQCVHFQDVLVRQPFLPLWLLGYSKLTLGLETNLEEVSCTLQPGGNWAWLSLPKWEQFLCSSSSL